MHKSKTFSDIEVGSVFRHDLKIWQKVSSTSARDVNPPKPMEFAPDLEVETLYEHKETE